MEKKRSRGVTIFGVLAIILSLVHLLPLVFYFLFLAGGICLIILPLSALFLNIFLGFAWLVAGIGCLRLEDYWGRIPMLFISVFVLSKDILFGIFTFRQNIDSIMNIYQEISRQQVLAVGIIYFLLEAAFLISLIVFFTRPKVKEQFR